MRFFNGMVDIMNTVTETEADFIFKMEDKVVYEQKPLEKGEYNRVYILHRCLLNELGCAETLPYPSDDVLDTYQYLEALQGILLSQKEVMQEWS